jgi:hypothetical protein
MVWLTRPVRWAVTMCVGAISCAVVASPAWSYSPGSPGREYEMVSPVFKAGYGASEIAGVAPHGDAVIYGGLIGAYAGSNSPAVPQYYRAFRSAAGNTGAWSSQALNLPAELTPVANPIAFSPSTEASAWVAPLGHFNIGSAEAEATEWQLMRRDPDGISSIGPVLRSRGAPYLILLGQGASYDLCHVILSADLPLTEEFPITLNVEQPYEVSGGCDGSTPMVSGVALNNVGAPLSPTCEVAVPHNENSTSFDGKSTFFEAESPDTSCRPERRHLYVRIDDSETLEVAQPLEEKCKQIVPCPGSGIRPGDLFDGASQDGSRVFFTTAAALEPTTDHDTKPDLYMATIGCTGGGDACEAGQREITSMTQISKTLSGSEESGIREVGPTSPDGSHVYFVAHGVLTDEGPTTSGTQSQPAAGAENLYLYEQDAHYPSGHVIFVSDLCSGPGLSGTVADQRCPDDLESGENERNDDSFSTAAATVQTVGPSGDMLVFSTFAQVINSGPEADTDDAKDVYRFDAESRSMVRVSVGEEDYHANGNGEDATKGEIGKDADASIQPSTGATIVNDQERKAITEAASEDGSRIVFSTAESLSPHAVNHLTDIYEWHLGKVSLISSGTSTSSDSDPVITPSGGEVFFVTDQGLRPQDTDTARDVYDARLGGGEATPPLEAEGCSGETCKGPLMTPAPLLVPGSLTQAPEKNLLPPKVTKAKIKKKPQKQRGKRRVKRTRRSGSHSGGGHK